MFCGLWASPAPQSRKLWAGTFSLGKVLLYCRERCYRAPSARTTEKTTQENLEILKAVLHSNLQLALIAEIHHITPVALAHPPQTQRAENDEPLAPSP